MKKKYLFTLFCVLALCFTFIPIVTVQAATDSSTVTEKPGAKIIHSYYKEIDRTYAIGTHPDIYTYKEYSAYYGAWFSGPLYVKTIVYNVASGTETVTYYGHIVGVI